VVHRDFQYAPHPPLSSSRFYNVERVSACQTPIAVTFRNGDDCLKSLDQFSVGIVTRRFHQEGHLALRTNNNFVRDYFYTTPNPFWVCFFPALVAMLGHIFFGEVDGGTPSGMPI
jgi:hypothetical protein